MSEKEPNKLNFSLLSTGVALGSYFLIKYGVAGQFYEPGEFPFIYNIILIFACMFLGKAVESAVGERKNKS